MLNSDCFSAREDVHGYGGVAFDFTKLEECQRECVVNKACVAFDWEPTNDGQSCWILTTTNIRPTTQPGVITHYVLLDRTCLG